MIDYKSYSDEGLMTTYDNLMYEIDFIIDTEWIDGYWNESEQCGEYNSLSDKLTKVRKELDKRGLLDDGEDDDDEDDIVVDKPIDDFKGVFYGRDEGDDGLNLPF